MNCSKGTLTWSLMMLLMMHLRKKQLLTDIDIMQMVEVTYVAIENINNDDGKRDEMLEEFYQFETSLMKAIEYASDRTTE